jgi:hypothetical protein
LLIENLEFSNPTIGNAGVFNQQSQSAISNPVSRRSIA